MAAPTESAPTIAGIGHVYVADPDTTPPAGFLDSFKFDTGSAPKGFTWLGDTSSETLPEFGSDGGDSTSKRTWDRKDLRVTREDKTHTMTIASVASSATAIETAFPGSTWSEPDKAWDIDLDGSVEKAVLMVIEDGTQACAHLFRRVSLSGALPTLDLENFSEISISGAIMTPASGEKKYRFYPPRERTVTGAAVRSASE